MAQGCARIDSGLDAAKIDSAGRVEVHRARLLASIGVRKTFPHGLGHKRKCRRFKIMSALPLIVLQKSQKAQRLISRQRAKRATVADQ